MIGHPLLAAVPMAEDGLPTGWPQDYGIATGGPSVLAWSECTLAQPDGDDCGQPWAWTQSQARFVCWWFALDGAGRYLWRRGQVVLPKGAGKSPMAAALACCELAGPVRFAGWEDDGQPIMSVHPSPDVKLSALSQSQAVDATLGLAVAMLDSPGACTAIPGLDAGITRIRTRRGILSPATARASSKEGSRYTSVILDESHLWDTANGGHRLAATLRRNLAKTGGRSLEMTNMWTSGAESVAEQTATYADAVESAEITGDGVLRWHPIGHCEDLADEQELRAALAQLYADSPWVEQDRIVAEIHDRGTHPADARRYYLNQPASADDAWLRADQWLACQDRARTIEDWQARDGEDTWEAPEQLIDAAIRDTFTRYRVVGMYADPSLWQARLGEWEQTYARKLKIRASAEHPMRWWVNRPGLMVKALAALEEAVQNGDLTHDGSYRLTEHVLNARRRPTPRVGMQISKEFSDSPRKIDAAIAATLAWQAHLDAVAKGATGTSQGRGRIIVLT